MSIRQKLAQWFYSPGAYGLWVALDDVDNWKIETHKAFYRSSSVDRYGNFSYVACMWIANGAFSFNGYDETPKFLGWFERHFIWRKFRRLNNRRMLFRFTRLEEAK